jgi:hypothetical protein
MIIKTQVTHAKETSNPIQNGADEKFAWLLAVTVLLAPDDPAPLPGAAADGEGNVRTGETDGGGDFCTDIGIASKKT